MNADAYANAYRRSLEEPEAFWRETAGRIDWIKPFTQIDDVSWDKEDLHIRWFADGTLNASANCIDRHLPAKKDETAIIWEGDDPDDDSTITYGELYEHVCRFATRCHVRGALPRTRTYP